MAEERPATQEGRCVVTASGEAEFALAALAGLPDKAIDPAEAALNLSALGGRVTNPDPYRQHLSEIASAVRDARAGYQQTLDVLAYVKCYNPRVLTKTSLMVGLGEMEEEVIDTLNDLRTAGVDIVTFGQYLRPTVNHLPVQRYVSPQEFDQYRAWGLERGFMEVVSGPLVRSSYRADRVLDKNNIGLNHVDGGLN